MSDSARFPGFPKAGFQFLAELAQNNDREWFKANQARYLESLREPLLDFNAALADGLADIASDLRLDPRTNGSGNLMRLHRDTRFSKDKSPYKTEVAALLWAGPGRKTEHPGFGYRIQPESFGMMAGAFHFPKPMLAVYREAVVDEKRGSAFVQAIAEVHAAGKAKGIEYELIAEHYKRVPRGYPADHPRGSLLKHNGFACFAPEVGLDIATTPAILDLTLEHFHNMAPIYHWLESLIVS